MRAPWTVGLALAILSIVGARGARAEEVKIQTLTITNDTFIRGGSEGKKLVVSGELEWPAGATGAVPAVVLMHGGSGVQPYQQLWARELRGLGFATLVVDSFSGRGLVRIANQLDALNAPSRVIDAYRSLELLAGNPRIDRERIAFMGFSHGGTAGVLAMQRRFRTTYGPREPEYAAWILFYAYCNTQVIGELEVSAAPIRFFHGTADTWTPVGACRSYAERLRTAGADAVFTEYPLAQHGFDNPQAPSLSRIPDAMNPSACFFVEKDGAVLNRDTGKPMTFKDACWTRGVTAGYHPEAYVDSMARVKELLQGLRGAPKIAPR
jgi:dienelactone hydrolase